MANKVELPSKTASRSLHTLGTVCGLTAGIWLGAAEAPTKFVAVGVSPFLISLGMVCGVFVARWTLPTVLKGSGYILHDLRDKPHLLLWGLLTGALWAVANTLSIFAIRDVGLELAFPLWNMASLVGMLWGWLFFQELRGAGFAGWMKVLGGGIAIVGGAAILSFGSFSQSGADAHRNLMGVLGALGAALLWGTMFLPYRKAYISGMNPLSFVTVFTFGELLTMGLLTVAFSHGVKPLLHDFEIARPATFWVFLGGFCWVIGDLFAQYGAKYIGIGRTGPLMCTNQLWGLAWGALVFGEMAGKSRITRALIVGGSVVMIAGAIAISTAIASEDEHSARRQATRRECERYGLEVERVEAAMTGSDPISGEAPGRSWWDIVIVAVAVAIFFWLAVSTQRPPFAIDAPWTAALIIILVASLIGCGYLLWKRTRFS